MTRLTLAFDAATLQAGDGPRLTGTAVPFGIASRPSQDGNRYRFSGGPENGMVGAATVRGHDDDAVEGRIATAEETGDRIDVTVDLLDTQLGRDGHTEAREGVRNGFSVRFEPIESTEGEDGVIDVSAWNILHLGHVRHPAFGDATPAAAASIHEPEEGTPMDTETETAPAPELAEADTAAVAPVLTVPRYAPAPSLAAYGFAVINGDTAALARMEQAINLAAGDTLVTNIPGVIPTQIIGPVIDGRPYDRPIFSALGPSAGPSAGASWKHPVVTDPLADAAAIAELASANDTLGITDVPVAWTAIKRSTVVSREAQIFSDPTVIGVVGEQLARSYSRGSEAVAAAKLVGHTGGNTAITVAADGSDAIAKIVAGSAIHYGQVGAPADVLFVNPAAYAQISGWKATDGRQLFPSVGQLVNAGGSTGGAVNFSGDIAGVRVVPSWGLTTGQNFLVSSDYVRSYEGNRATISVESANFGVTVGIFGTVALAVLLAKAVTPVTITPAPLAASAKK